jgi:hypothetical protein
MAGAFFVDKFSLYQCGAMQEYYVIIGVFGVDREFGY